MSLHFAHGRSILNSEDWSITSSVGGNLNAQNLYFSLQAANESGKNLILKSTLINISEGDKLTFTINPSAKLNGEGWTHYVIGVSNTDNVENFDQIAKIPCYTLDVADNINYDGALSFPLTLEITEQSQLITGEFVDTLPTENIVDGMVRGLTTDNKIYEYDFRSDEWYVVDKFTTNVVDITQIGGCAIDLTKITNLSRLKIPTYEPDGTNSAKIQYYLTNDTGFEITAGTAIKLLIDIDGYDKSRLFDNKVFYTIKGFVTPDNYVLRKTYVDAGQPLEFVDYEQIYTANKPSLDIKDKIRVGESVFLELFINIHEQEFIGGLSQGNVTIIPQFLKNAPRYNPTGFINETKGAINNTYGKRRVKPYVVASSIIAAGEGTVKNYSFFQPENILTGFAENTPDQKVYINRSGIVFIDTQERADTVLRAIVDTTAKESHIAQWTAPQTVSENDALRITVTYPCDENLNANVRSDYPDNLQNEVIYFNVKKINFYIKRSSNGEIRKFTNFLVVAAQPQDFTITSWSDGVVVEETQLPTTKHSFFNPNSLAVINVGNFGDFPADTYYVTHTYVWEGDRISDVSHLESDGCIPEIGANLININDVVVNYPILETTVNNTNNITTNLNNINNGLDLDNWTPEEESPGDSLIVVNPTEELGDPDVGEYPASTVYRYNANSFNSTTGLGGSFVGEWEPNNSDLNLESEHYQYRKALTFYYSPGFVGNRKVIYRNEPNNNPKMSWDSRVVHESRDFTFSFYAIDGSLKLGGIRPDGSWLFPANPINNTPIKAYLFFNTNKFSIINVNNVIDNNPYTFETNNAIDNDFHHVVLTRENLTFKYYVDGILLHTYNCPGNTVYTSEPNLIFAINDSTHPYYPMGYISGLTNYKLHLNAKEIVYFNIANTALTEQEIADEFAKIETYDVGAFPSSWTKRLQGFYPNGSWFSTITNKASFQTKQAYGSSSSFVSNENETVIPAEIDQLKVLAFNKEGLIFTPQTSTSRIIPDALGNFTLSFWVKFKTIKTYDWIFYWGEQMVLQLIEPNYVSLTISSIIDNVKTDYFLTTEINLEEFNYIVIKREGDVFKLSTNNGIIYQVVAPNIVFDPDSSVGIGGYSPNMLPQTPETLPTYSPKGQYPVSQIHRYTWQSLNVTTKVWEDEIVNNPINSNVFGWNILTSQKSFSILGPIEFNPTALDTSDNFTVSLLSRYGNTTQPNGQSVQHTVFTAFTAGNTTLTLSTNYANYKLTLTKDGLTRFSAGTWSKAGKFTYVVITKEFDQLNLYVNCKKMIPIVIPGSTTLSFNRLSVGGDNAIGNISYFAIANTALTPAEQALELQKITTT